jgi:hypothetical protein
MRRNFHLISSVGYEILSSCVGMHDVNSALVNPRSQGGAAAEHAVDRLPE